jgi:protease-4
MPLDSLLVVAGGRVWTGEDARPLRLTDLNGSLDDATAIAATKAGLPENDFTVRYYPGKISFWESIRNADDIFGQYYLQRELKELYPLHQSWQQLQQLQGL